MYLDFWYFVGTRCAARISHLSRLASAVSPSTEELLVTLPRTCQNDDMELLEGLNLSSKSLLPTVLISWSLG
jgi:hypothetical protein